MNLNFNIDSNTFKFISEKLGDDFIKSLPTCVMDYNLEDGTDCEPEHPSCEEMSFIEEPVKGIMLPSKRPFVAVCYYVKGNDNYQKAYELFFQRHSDKLKNWTSSTYWPQKYGFNSICASSMRDEKEFVWLKTLLEKNHVEFFLQFQKVQCKVEICTKKYLDSLTANENLKKTAEEKKM